MKRPTAAQLRALAQYPDSQYDTETGHLAVYDDGQGYFSIIGRAGEVLVTTRPWQLDVCPT